MARVRLNRIDLGIVWRPPFRLNLGKAMQPGVNTLEVTTSSKMPDSISATARI